MKIRDILLEYNSKLDNLDIELIIAHILNKPREFVLAHPEHQLNKIQETRYEQLVKRRIKHEPLAYILGHKEFYGLDFKVNKNVLIPRPETELLVEEVISYVSNILSNTLSNTKIIDIGTGSGNIIISIAKSLCSNCHSREGGNPVAKLSVSTLDSRIRGNDIDFYGIDISEKALRVAKYNARKNKADKKIKFINSDLLNYFFKNKKDLLKIVNCKLIIVCNLPYLSQEIYSSAMPDVKNYEPRSALFSEKDGLDHYEKLFKQLKLLKKSCFMLHASCFMEFSPEQKNKMQKLISKYFPQAKINFKKDLAGKWRVATIKI